MNILTILVYSILLSMLPMKDGQILPAETIQWPHVFLILVFIIYCIITVYLFARKIKCRIILYPMIVFNIYTFIVDMIATIQGGMTADLTAVFRLVPFFILLFFASIVIGYNNDRKEKEWEES